MRKNNKLDNVVYTKIGSCHYNFYRDALKNVSKEEITKFVELEESLEKCERFFIDKNGFLFHIYYNHIKGHKLFLKRSDVYGQLDVYSTNYEDVIKNEDIQKAKKR